MEMQESFVERWHEASSSDRSALMDELGFSIGRDPLLGWRLLRVVQSTLNMGNFDAASCTRVALVSFLCFILVYLKHFVSVFAKYWTFFANGVFVVITLLLIVNHQHYLV